jgi:hypothetical protein
MERKEQEPSCGPPQAAEGGDNQLSEEKRAIVALRILSSGPLDGKSLRLLEQLADCIQRPQAEVLKEAEPAKQVAAQQITTMEKSRPRPSPRRCRRGS